MQIRQYLSGDEQKILALDWQLFPDPYQKRTLENWNWKYKGNNPAGDSIIYVMEHNDEIIAHFAAIPIQTKYFNKSVTASHSIASMVALPYQNKGIIKFVSDKVLNEIESKDIAFTWGFPNDRAYEYHKKLLKYADISEIYSFQKSYEDLKKNNCGVKCIFKIESFDSEADDLWNLSKHQWNIAVERTKEFLNWRYINRPDQKYSAFGFYENDILTGYIILKIFQGANEKRGHIIDILTLPNRDDIFNFLINYAEIFFSEMQVNIVNSWILGNKKYISLLKNNGYKPVSSKPLICRINFTEYMQALNEDNWYFAMGDSLEIF